MSDKFLFERYFAYIYMYKNAKTQHIVTVKISLKKLKKS